DDAIVGDIGDLDDLDQLVELLLDLLHLRRRTVDDNRHARHPFFLSGTNRETLDIESPPAEETGDPIQDAGMVLNERNNSAIRAHARTFFSRGSSTVSASDAPAGTIGQTFSS